MVFPVVMYRCERWTIKKAESQRIDAFELWCWKILLKSPLDSTEIKPINPKGNQPRIFIGRTDAEAGAPVLDMKRYLYLIRKANSLEKTLMLGKIESRREKGGSRGWDGWMASLTQWTWLWANWEIVKDREVWRATVPGVIKSQTRLSGWTTTMAWNSIILMYPWQRKGLRCSYLC